LIGYGESSRGINVVNVIIIVNIKLIVKMMSLMGHVCVYGMITTKLLLKVVAVNGGLIWRGLSLVTLTAVYG